MIRHSIRCDLVVVVRSKLLGLLLLLPRCVRWVETSGVGIHQGSRKSKWMMKCWMIDALTIWRGKDLFTVRSLCTSCDVGLIELLSREGYLFSGDSVWGREVGATFGGLLDRLCLLVGATRTCFRHGHYHRAENGSNQDQIASQKYNVGALFCVNGLCCLTRQHSTREKIGANPTTLFEIEQEPRSRS